MSRRARWEWESKMDKVQAQRTANQNLDREQRKNSQEQQDRVKQQISNEQNRTKQVIADAQIELKKDHMEKQLALTEKIENKRIRLKEIEVQEKANAQITVAIVTERKELQQQVNAYHNEYSLNQQRLELDLIKAEDEFQKEITLKNGLYSFKLQEGKQAQDADYRKTELVRQYDEKLKQLEIQSLQRLKEIDVRQEQWKIKAEYTHKLGLIEAETRAYKQKLSADVQADVQKQATESINYAFKRTIDTKLEIILMRAKKEIFGGREPTEAEIEEILKSRKFYWDKEL